MTSQYTIFSYHSVNYYYFSKPFSILFSKLPSTLFSKLFRTPPGVFSVNYTVVYSPNALPQSDKHRVKGLNAIGCGSFSECSQSKSSDGPNLLLLINQTILNDLHQRLEVRENCTAHQDSDLLDYLDPGMACLP